MWSRRVQRAATGVLVMALASAWMATLQARQDLPAPVADLAAGLTLEQVAFSSPADPRIDIRLWLKPGAEDRAGRVIEVTEASLRLFGEWYGAFPQSQLTIVDAPWHSPAIGASYPAAVVTSTRWMAIERDGSSDRSLIAALARQYWFGVASPPAFEEGLSRYSAARAIDAVLQGRQFWSRRFFGGIVPFAVRSLPLSQARTAGRGRVPAYDELPAGPEHAQGTGITLALHTLERYLGWPALQQGLLAFRDRFRSGGGTPEELLRILNEQGGRDLTWFFAEAFRPGARFDYGIEAFTSVADGSRHRITLALRRFGNATFAGTSEPRESAAGRAIPVKIHLTDGTDVREWWDGRDQTHALEYLSAVPAATAQVDPDRMLLLDADRSNNTRRVSALPPYLPARRGIVSWMLWLQDLMLTATALA